MEPIAKAESVTRRFYVVMASICVAVAFLGFVPSYWLPVVKGVPQPFLIHLHGLLFFSWTLYFLLQTSLVVTGKTTRHRDLGIAGAALAAIMCCVGLLITIRSLHVSAALGFAEAAKAFSIVSFSAVLLFAGFIAAAFANTRNREQHKRLMLIATIGMLQPAVARWFLLALRPEGAVGPPPIEVTIGPAIVANLLIVAAMIYDKRMRGSVHPAYWIGGGVLLAVQVLRVPFSHTAGWMSFADWLASASL